MGRVVEVKKSKDEASCLTMSLQSGCWGFKPISPGSKIRSPKNLPLLFFFLFPQIFSKQNHRRHKHMEALTPLAEELN
jgi:hypothetical protein